MGEKTADNAKEGEIKKKKIEDITQIFFCLI